MSTNNRSFRVPFESGAVTAAALITVFLPGCLDGEQFATEQHPSNLEHPTTKTKTVLPVSIELEPAVHPLVLLAPIQYGQCDGCVALEPGGPERPMIGPGPLVVVGNYLAVADPLNARLNFYDRVDGLFVRAIKNITVEHLASNDDYLAVLDRRPSEVSMRTYRILGNGSGIQIQESVGDERRFERESDQDYAAPIPGDVNGAPVFRFQLRGREFTGAADTVDERSRIYVLRFNGPWLDDSYFPIFVAGSEDPGRMILGATQPATDHLYPAEGLGSGVGRVAEDSGTVYFLVVRKSRASIEYLNIDAILSNEGARKQ